MRTRQQYVDDYRAAMSSESELWRQIGGRGPGQPGYDPALWQQWLQAVNRTTAASKALREAFTDILKQ